MGCGCFKAKQSKEDKIVFTKTKNLSTDLNLVKRYVYVIPKSSWIYIIDFLNFKEVKESKKVNKMFNSICCSFHILIKFYKNKTYYQACNTMKTMQSMDIEYITPTYSNSNIEFPSFHKGPSYGSRQSCINHCSSGYSSIYSGSLNSKSRLTLMRMNGETEHQHLSKFVNNNPGLYTDLYNKTEIDWNKIKHMESSKNHSLDKTPSFSSTYKMMEDICSISNETSTIESATLIKIRNPRGKNNRTFYHPSNLPIIAEELRVERCSTGKVNFNSEVWKK